MRISDWSSDVCSSDLTVFMVLPTSTQPADAVRDLVATTRALAEQLNAEVFDANRQVFTAEAQRVLMAEVEAWAKHNGLRSKEHTSELQSLMRTSYAVFCLKKKTYTTTQSVRC